MKQEKKKVDAHPGVSETIHKHLATLVGLCCVASLFVVIFGVAVGIGGLMHLAELHCPWMSPWMFKVGHFVEGTLFVIDIGLLLHGVIREVCQEALRDTLASIKSLFGQKDK